MEHEDTHVDNQTLLLVTSPLHYNFKIMKNKTEKDKELQLH